ncbi:hypothetical protein N9E34_03720 [Opitutales bacterium]|nr:hypothetical protein [Opitutales bacterium]
MFTVNALGESSFDESDIFSSRAKKQGAPSSVYDYAATRVSLANLKNEVFSTLSNLAQSPGSFIHDGSVFKQEIDTIKHALEEAYVRTDLVENGFDNFASGLDGVYGSPSQSLTTKYNVHIASRSGGVASVQFAGNGEAQIGEDVLITSPFTSAGRNFILGEVITLTSESSVTENGVEYALEVGKFKKEIPKTANNVYEHGTSLVIKATPLLGHTFLKWEQGGETEDLITVTPTDNFYTEATFIKDD